MLVCNDLRSHLLILCYFSVMPLHISDVQRLWYIQMDDTLLKVSWIDV